MANTDSKGLQGREETRNTFTKRTEQNKHFAGRSESRATWAVEPELGGMLNGISDRLDGIRWPAGPGLEQYEWEHSRTATGVKNRKDRLKSLGNAVVPQQIYLILAAIKQIDNMEVRD